MKDIMKPCFKKEYGEAEAKKLEKSVDRLESIKEMIRDYRKEPAYTPFGDYVGLGDVEYLLQRLEIAQKALGHVEAECTMYPANQMSIDRIVKQALDQLKE